MQNIDPALIEEFLRKSNESPNGSAPAINLLPESFLNALTLGFIALNVVAVLFLIVYVFSAIRKWKVQSAVLHMQKDVAEIKAALAGTDTRPAPVVDNDTKKIA